MQTHIHLTELQLQSLFDRTCDETELKIINAHLGQCTVCTNELQKIKRIDRLIKTEYKVAPLSFNLSEKVADVIIFKPGKKPFLLFDNFFYTFLLVMALSVFVYFLIISIQQSRAIVLLTFIVSISLYFLVSHGEIKKYRYKADKLISGII